MMREAIFKLAWIILIVDNMRKLPVFEGLTIIVVVLILFILLGMGRANGQQAVYESNLSSSPVLNVYVGSDGTLYTFTGDTGNTVHAFDNAGKEKWNLNISDNWIVSSDLPQNAISLMPSVSSWLPDVGGSYNYPEPVVSTSGGNLYLCVMKNMSGIDLSEGKVWTNDSVMAISPDGRILWVRQIDSGIYGQGAYQWAMSVNAVNDRIYAWANDTLTIFDGEGSALFKYRNVSAPPALGDDGMMYVIPSDMPGTIKAVYPNGTLWWSRNISMPIGLYPLDYPQNKQLDHRPFAFGQLPIYANGTVYAPVQNGIWAFDAHNGSYKWYYDLNRYDNCELLYPDPIDKDGRVYFLSSNENGNLSYVILFADGQSSSTRPAYGYPFEVRRDGICYYLNETIVTRPGDLENNNVTLGDMHPVQLIAYDMINNRTLWSAQLPLSQPVNATLNASNVNNYLDQVEATYASYINSQPNFDEGATLRGVSERSANILPGDNIVYASFYDATYEYPVIFNRSQCVLSSSIYAFDKNGSLVWSKPVDSIVTSMAANNSTVYVGTNGGNLFIVSMGVVGGIALLALAFLFIKFFCIGTVSRAKSRLNKNPNRNFVYDFILKNPGFTQKDISRMLGINLGTVRYHLLILSINHRIVSYMGDDKHVRYFTNSNSFSKEDQLVISLIRREGVRKILAMLQKNPGITNVELSNALGIQTSAITRYMKELSEKGIVTKDWQTDGGYAYSIKDDQKNRVTLMMERTNNSLV